MAFKRVPRWLVTLGQQCNYTGEKPTVILYTYINRHAETPDKNNLIIIYNNSSLEHKQCYNIVIGKRKYICILQQVHRDILLDIYSKQHRLPSNLSVSLPPTANIYIHPQISYSVLTESVAYTRTFNMPTSYQYWVWEREAHINWSMVTCQSSTRSELP